MISELSHKEKRVLFAKLSGIAYDDIKDARLSAKRLGFTKTVLIDIEGAQTYVFSSKYDVAIACRGTEPSEMNDVYADLEIFKADSVTGNKIHQGFKEEVDKVYSDVESLLDRISKNKSIWACGHSLGGAMATILAQRLEYKDGYDIDLLNIVSNEVNIPVIASGGAGTMEHIYDALVVGNSDAVLAASIFHFEELTIQQVKKFLNSKGVSVRL